MNASNGFRISGLDPSPYRHLYGQPDPVLARHGVHRIVASAHARYPDRVSLQDAQPGETLLLLNHRHLDPPSPYAATHAIYVREGALKVAHYHGCLPPDWQGRTLAIRAIDARAWILQARLAESAEAPGVIAELLADPMVTHLNVHYPATGCLAARIERCEETQP